MRIDCGRRRHAGGGGSAGVLDVFFESRFDPFQLYIGVSAGACNLSSQVAALKSDYQLGRAQGEAALEGLMGRYSG